MQHQTRLERVLALLCSVLDAYSAVLFLPVKGETPAVYRMAASFSLGNLLNPEAEQAEGRGLVGWILRTGEPLLVSDFDRKRNQLGYYAEGEERHIKAFMGCALPGGAGALCVDSKRQYSFTERDQKLLHLFAQLIRDMQAEWDAEADRRVMAKYYGALRAIHELRREHTRWKNFLRHFLELLAAITDNSYAMFCSRSATGEAYVVEGESRPLLALGSTPPSYPMSHGVVGWVFRNSSPVFSDGPDGLPPDAPLVGHNQDIPRFQSVIALPLIMQRKTRGVLCLAGDTPREPDEACNDFIRMVAEHLALFLENLYIKCRLREKNQQFSSAAKEFAE